MKLDVGMYVRTNFGIKKIYEIDNNKTKWKYLYKLKKQDDDGSVNLGALCDDDIVGEPSFRITDLIKIGDYVNGNPVCQIKKEEYGRTWIYTDSNYKYGYLEEDIVDVVTKEQFENMKYVIEREN